jgi:GT2 family glycosyltransferase
VISVVILTLNSIKFIKPCLDSILSQDAKAVEIIVVDNGSVDGTAIFIRENYPQVSLIQNKVNLGAAKARNQGIQAAKGKWIFSLDCDTVLKKDFFYNIENAVKILTAEVGIIQPKILQANQKTVYSTGIFISYLRKFYDIGKGKKDSGQFDRSRQIFGACSAAALYKKDMLDKIKETTGYFDERFFFLFEDVDLSWRAQNKGWRVLFYPKAVCYHYGNSSATPKETRQYLCLRNRYFTLLKNDALKKYILAFIFYDLARFFWILITNPGALRAVKDAFIFKANLKRQNKITYEK